MAIKQKDLIAKSTSSCEAEIASSEALQQGEDISIVISEMINTSCDIEVSNDTAAALGPVWIRDSMENPSHQCQSTLVASNVEKRNQVDVLGLGQDPFWHDRVKAFYGWYSKSGSKEGQDAWTWEGKDNQKWPTTRGVSKRNQSVPANPADRTDPNEKGLQWRDLGEINLQQSYLCPGKESDPACPIVEKRYLSKDDQQLYMQWIETILDLDRRTSKDPRLYCAYCDMNNHPRFACKRAYKHQKENEKHRCTLCSAFHAPFRCPRAECNGGSGKPNWSRVEYKRAKQESREPDLRWGADAAQTPVDFPTFDPQQRQSASEDQQLMCAATAMMHGIPSGASSSWQGGCPLIHEHREWAPPVAQNDVIIPNPGYRESALRPGPIASFLHHSNTMESPPNPSYLHGGPQPADDIQHLSREASMESLIELQRYA